MKLPNTLTLSVLLTLLSCSLAPCVQQETKASDSIRSPTTHDEPTSESRLEQRLKLAGNNRPEIEKALRDSPSEYRTATRFLVQNMRSSDLKSLSAEFILEDVRLAYEARKMAPWAETIPEKVFLNEVLPFANITEQREAWRSKLKEICAPIVKDRKTTAEAAQAINREMFKIVKVKYSRKRKKAIQSPSESIEQGLASCTGLSILLVDACRSVSIPARVVGIPSWTTRRGNHTWVEIWSDGEWHFTGAAEYDPKGLNRGWFTNAASLADKSKRQHSIFAVSFARTDTTFHMARTRDPENAVYAVNVTDRYTQGNQVDKPISADQVVVRIRVWESGKSKRVAVPIEIRLASDQTRVGQGKSLGDQADLNNMFEVKLKRGTQYKIRLGSGQETDIRTITTNDSETQLLEFETGAKGK